MSTENGCKKLLFVFKNAFFYGMWFFNLGLSVWLFFISSTTFLAFLARTYHPGDYQSSIVAELAEKTFTLLFGVVCFVLIFLIDEYYRGRINKGRLTKRFARATGGILWCIFLADLILIGLQGFDGEDWLRWLILSVEFVIGLGLGVYSKTNGPNKSVWPPLTTRYSN